MSKLKDVVGEKYNMLTITGIAPSKREPSGASVKRVYTVCECGGTNESSYKNLKRGLIKSCGCLSENNKRKIEIGQQFTHWTVLKETEGYIIDGKKEARKMLCKCVCGKEKEVHLDSLTKGQSKSCGCLGREKKIKEEKIKIIPQNTEEENWKQSINYPNYYISTLGKMFNYKIQKYLSNNLSLKIEGKDITVVKEMYITFVGEYDKSIFYPFLVGEEVKLENIILREFNTPRVKRIRGAYANIKSRCYNENCKDYSNYGGRGIILEECFDTFDKFFDWSINNGYENNLEIDREDNDGNYSVKNCRWVTKADNTRNRRVSVMDWDLVYKIREGEYSGMTTQEVANIIGCSWSTVESVKNFKTWNK